jgi:predicted Zn-dependent protease
MGFSLGNQTLRLYLVALVSVSNLKCVSTTPASDSVVDRPQFITASSQKLIRNSHKLYRQMILSAQRAGSLDIDPQKKNQLDKIFNQLISQVGNFRQDAKEWPWEIHLIESNEVNAFCFPGGQIIFYSGLINSLQLTEDEIAAVLGHEIAHALREHGRERFSHHEVNQSVSRTMFAVLAGIGAMDGTSAYTASQEGARFMNRTIRKPFGVSQETEADLIGAEIMARSGYNPEAAISLWQKFSSSSKENPIQWIESHPTHQKRIENLRNHLRNIKPLSSVSR